MSGPHAEPDPLRADERAPVAPLKSYRTILQEEIRFAEAELTRPTSGLLVSGLTAGLGIGTSVLLLGVVLTLTGGEPGTPTTALVTAGAYAVGFVIVILGRTDLFTEYTTIAMLPLFCGAAEVLVGVIAGTRAGPSDFVRFLFWTTFGNAAGGVLFALLIRYSAVARSARTDED